jgi:phosphoenolpyruvate synthase/pyruvate phosphate dikinase
MIEVPRAALIADLIAEKADFFSFGTNDLTQMTFGYSRDDAGKFLPIYIEKGILKGSDRRAPIKILVGGEYNKALTFKGIEKFSKSALEAVEKAGGSVEVIAAAQPEHEKKAARHEANKAAKAK